MPRPGHSSRYTGAITVTTASEADTHSPCWPSEEERAGCGEPHGLSFPVCLPVPVFPGVPVGVAWGALRKGFQQVLWLILEPLPGAGRMKWGSGGAWRVQSSPVLGVQEGFLVPSD